MAAKTKAEVLQAAPEAIPGLAEADAKAAEVFARFRDLRAQIQQANADTAAGVAKRDVLLARAKAGEIILPAEVAEAEAATRTTEATAGLLAAAMPAVLCQLEEAEREVMRLACTPKFTEIRAAEERYEAAKAAVDAALKERSEAWQAHEAQCRWTMADGGDTELAKYAPSSLERKKAVAAIQEAERKAERQRQERERQSREHEARQREIGRAEAQVYLDRRQQVPDHLRQYVG